MSSGRSPWRRAKCSISKSESVRYRSCSTSTVGKVAGLPSTPGGQHTVKVIARGARVYPDPDQPHTPLDGGTLATECRFVVQG